MEDRGSHPETNKSTDTPPRDPRDDKTAPSERDRDTVATEPKRPFTDWASI